MEILLAATLSPLPVLLALAVGFPATTTELRAQDVAPCSSPEHRRFDFWVGDWEVFDAQGHRAGTNVIERTLDGCVIRESWTGAGGMRGTSLNIYDVRDGLWHQTWVDSRGRRLELAGAYHGDRMVLEGTVPSEDDPGRVVHHRITWSRLDGGRVRQLWEASRDDGKTWSVVFDGTYVPKG